MTDRTDQRLIASLAPRGDEIWTAQQADLEHIANRLIAIAAQLRSSSQQTGNDVGLKSGTQSLQRRAGQEVGPGDIGQLGVAETTAMRRMNAEVAREIYATRRSRTAIFDNHELFGEPAWDILLDLYVAHVESKPVSVSSACIGSAAPPTTGLRWLGVLAEQDLILREHDPEDQRRVLVRLTDTGLAAMDKYFASNAAPA